MTFRTRIDHLPEDRRLTGLGPALLSADFDDVLQSIVVQAAEKVGTPIALVTLVLDHIQLFRAHHGLPDDLAELRATARDASFCQLVVRDDAVVDVEDAAKRADLPQDLVERYGIRAYLGAPIHLGDQPLGSLCVIDTQPRAFTAEDRALLRLLAREVDARIEAWSASAHTAPVGTVRAAVGPVFAEMRNHLGPLMMVGGELRLLVTELEAFLRGLRHGPRGHGAMPAPAEMADTLRLLSRAAEWTESATQGLLSGIQLLEGLVDHRSTSAEMGALIEQVDGLCRHLSETAGGLHWQAPPPRVHAALSLPVAVLVTASLLNRLLLRVRSRATDGLTCRIAPEAGRIVLECRAPVLQRDDVEALAAEVTSMRLQMNLPHDVAVTGDAGVVRIHLPRAADRAPPPRSADQGASTASV